MNNWLNIEIVVWSEQNKLRVYQLFTFSQETVVRINVENRFKKSRAEPSQAKPSQAKPSQAKPSQAKPDHMWNIE